MATGLVVMGTTLAPEGASEWRGDDGACDIRATWYPEGGERAWRVQLELPGWAEPVAVGWGATRDAAEREMRRELSARLRVAVGMRGAS